MSTICTFQNAKGQQVLFVQRPLTKTGHALMPAVMSTSTEIGVSLAVLPPPVDAIANVNTAA